MRDQWEIHGNFQELTYLPGRYPLDPSDFISHLASRYSTDIYIYIYRGTIARINLRETITNYIYIRRQLICFIMFICLGYSSVFIDSLSTVYTAYIHVILWHLMDCDSPPCDSFNPKI